MVRIVFYLILSFLSSGAAILVGGVPERVGAIILLWLYFGALLFQGTFVNGGVNSQLGEMLVDGAALPFCVFLALNMKRHWTVWFCAAQIMAVFARIAHYLLIQESGLAYGMMTRIPGYIQSIVLLMGAIAHHRRTKSGSSPD